MKTNTWQKIKKLKIDYVVFSVILLILTIYLSINCVIKINNTSAQIANSTVFLRIYFGLVIFIIMFTGLLTGWMFIYRKSRTENIFAVSAAGLGIVMSLLITPFAVPDEEMHFNSVYAISNSILELKLPNNDMDVYERADDATIPLTFEVSTQNYVTVAENFFRGPQRTDYIHKQTLSLETDSFLFYMPAVIGNITGRWLDIGTIQMMYLCRTLMFAAYLCMVYTAIRLIPFGKNTMFLIGIMPMTMQQSMSMSYDSTIIGVSMLFSAIMVRFIYSDRVPSKAEIVAAVITGFLVVVAKSGAYSPLLLLAFAIPAEHFGGRKKKAITAAVAALAAGLVLAYIYAGVFGGSGGSDGEHIISWSGTEGFTLGQILSDPVKSIKFLYSTIRYHADEYILMMTGSYFGWLKIVVNPFIVLLYLVWVIATAFEKSDAYHINVKQKTLYIFATVCSCLIIFLSMWLFWTPFNYPFIAGIQGRYFIPLIFVVLLVFRNRKFGIKQNIQNKLVLAAYLTEVLIICQLIEKTSIY